jgi:arylsulfatase A
MLHTYFRKKNARKTVIIFFVFACLSIPGVHAQKAAQANKPNIIFILADDIGYSLPTVNGGQSYSTPHIDSMARHGMNFTHCESSPMCNTSRYLFLTGKYNFRNYSNWGYMDDNTKTIANVMHDAGYTTGMFGKTQMQYKNTTMQNWGWDYNIVFELIEDTMAFRRYKSPALIENGYRIPDSVTANKYCDDIVTQKMFNFINSHDNSKPFFVYYPMSLCHWPYSPTPDDAAFAGWNARSSKSDTSFFPSMIHYMDKKVGMIINWLHAKGLDTNTIVLFAGDNGTPHEIYYNADGVNHIRGEKAFPTEGGTHVPLIAYWPKHIQQKTTNDDLISFEDFLPTFAEVAQVTDLSKYGKLDGLSFYASLFQQPHTAKQQLFFHFDPNPGFDDLKRWVRDKTYKLYGTTGKFYNIVKDEKEQHPMADAALTASEKQIKQRFKNILDTVGTWPNAPVINNPFSDKITNTSATITATIISSGASKLIDRGSTLLRSTPAYDSPYLKSGRMHASIVALGTFSQVRTGLFPQTRYDYSLYAMNNNKSHSTAFALSSFYTLSNPVLVQPGSFTASVNTGVVTLNWANAQFPAKGAKNAGYLLIYSSDSIKILQNSNGKSPDSIIVRGRIVPVVSTVLPKKPVTSATKAGLLSGTYQFKLIPYTWDGSNSATYNYLTKNARTTTAVIGFAIKSNAVDNDSNTLAVISKEGILLKIYPNPAKSVLNVEFSDKAALKKIITMYDVAGKLLLTKSAEGNTQIDMKQLSAGTYLMQINDEGGKLLYEGKILKQ